MCDITDCGGFLYLVKVKAFHEADLFVLLFHFTITEQHMLVQHILTS